MDNDSGEISKKIEWIKIFLIDKNKYPLFGFNYIENKKYPPSNLFDNNLNTCWVSGSDKKNAHLFLKLPNTKKIVFNIFPGYGKSKTLYLQNARPKKIKFTFYSAINPSGYVSENGFQYMAAKFSQELTMQIKNNFEMQSIPINILQKELDNFINTISKVYDSEFKIPKAEQCLILKLEILEIYPGNKYSDVCISEIYFTE